MSRYACFPDVFYVICRYDNEGMDFETIDATINEEVAQEQVMSYAFEEAYEIAMEVLQDIRSDRVDFAKTIFKVRLSCPRYFYKKVDLRKEM